MRSSIVTRMATKLGVLLVLVMGVGGGVLAASAAATTAPPQWHPKEGVVYTMNGGGEGEYTFETAQGSSSVTKIKCTGSNASLEPALYSGGRQTRTEGKGMALHRCTTARGGTCTSSGASAGDILLNPMILRLEYLSPEKHEVGLVLNYHPSGEVTTFTSFGCTVLGITTKFTLRGTALAKITPVNVFTQAWTYALNGSAGKPELTEYVNGEGKKVVTKLEEEVNGSKSWEAVDMTGNPTITSFGYTLKLEG